MKIQTPQMEKYLSHRQGGYSREDRQALLLYGREYIEGIVSPMGTLSPSDTNRRTLFVKELRTDRVRSSEKEDIG